MSGEKKDPDKGQRGYAILAPVAGRSRLARDRDGATRTLGRGEDLTSNEELVRGPMALRGFSSGRGVSPVRMNAGS